MGSSLGKNSVLNEEHPDRWDRREVNQWLEMQGFAKYKSIVMKHNLKGKQLLEVDEAKLIKLGMTDKSDIQRLLDRVYVLKENMVIYSLTEEDELRVNATLNKFAKLFGPSALHSAMHKNNARNLSIKKCMLNTYLSEDKVATARIVSQLLNEERKDETSSILKAFTSDSQVPTLSTFDDGLNTLDPNDLDITKMLNDFTAWSPDKPEPILKVKLVVVEIHKTDAQRALRRVLAPIMDNIGMGQQFGLFHTALIIGPWYLEWNDSSVVIPRKCFSGAAFLAADVGMTFTGNSSVQQIIERAAEVVCHWNTNYTYSKTGRNCQMFVDELCAALGIPLDFSGALGVYLDRVRKEGYCDVSFPISDQLRILLGTQETKKVFKNHQELDQFYRLVESKDYEYFYQNPSDKLLLKSFDRAFWLRHFKDPDDENMRPEALNDHTLHTSCPFMHPSSTFSMQNAF